MLSRLEFLITETFLSFRRHPGMAFAAIACVAGALFIAGIAGLVIVNAEYAVDVQLDRLRFNVYFQRETTRHEAWVAYKRILTVPGVEAAEFIAKEKKWAELKREKPVLTQALQRNPFPDAIIIKATDVGLIPTLQRELKAWPEVRKVHHAADIAEKLDLIRHVMSRIGSLIALGLAFFSLVIIHHTIELTLYARRKEIHIMTLVGATPTTVALPFLLEGMLYGLLGGGVAIGGLWGFYELAVQRMYAHFSVRLLHDIDLLSHGALILGALGIGLGLTGSMISVIKYLHRPRSRITNA
jgi:cell division transport system permease protein